MINFLPIGNKLLFSIKSFRSSQTGTDITNDTSMVCNIYNSSGSLVVGPITMTHSAGGDYYGSAVPSPTLTENARYQVVITSGTYAARWVRWFKAEERGFPE